MSRRWKMIFFTMMAVSVLFLIINNVAVLVGIFPRSEFRFSIQAVVLLITSGCFYMFKTGGVRWFGDALDAEHTVSKVVTLVFMCVCMLPALFFSLSPWLGFLD